ncbi:MULTISPECIES: flagellar basal body rod protein FlgB [unclassified Nocardioides]|uniref:flagellar basal body rod protein FlgB n=1 Tax=unclassified Nocardioides TaxID=2615069 RepID=UPI00360808FA
MSFLSDPVGAILGSALDGISMRQRVIADNIANVDTPHYRASSVDFESSLRSAIGAGEITGGDELAPTVTATDTPVGANGNNVDLRKETMAAVQTQFQYQLMTRATTDRHNILKTVVAS